MKEERKWRQKLPELCGDKCEDTRPGHCKNSCVIVSTQRSICKWIIESASGISVSMDQPEAVYAACSTSDKVWGAPPLPSGAWILRMIKFMRPCHAGWIARSTDRRRYFFGTGTGMPGIFTLTAPEVVAAGEVQRLPVIAAEPQVRGGRSPVHNAAQLLSRRVHDPDTACAATIDIALGIHLHAVGNTGFCSHAGRRTRGRSVSPACRWASCRTRGCGRGAKSLM